MYTKSISLNMFDVNAFSVKYSLRVYTDVISTKSNIKFPRTMPKKGNAAKIHIQKTTVVDMEFCICYNKVNNIKRIFYSEVIP